MFRLTAAFMFLAATSAALAHTGVKNAQVMARMEAMEQIAAATKTLSEMAKRQIPFDAATDSCSVDLHRRFPARSGGNPVNGSF